MATKEHPVAPKEVVTSSEAGEQVLGELLNDEQLEALRAVAETNERDPAAIEARAQVIRGLENYQSFKALYQEGEFSLEYLVERFAGATEPPAYFDAEDIPVAQQLIADINAGLVPPPDPEVVRAKAEAAAREAAAEEVSQVAERTSGAEQKDFKNLEQSPAFEVLNQLYIQGMEAEEMAQRLMVSKAELKQGKADLLLSRLANRYGDFKDVRGKMSGRQWNKAVGTYVRWLKEEEFNPAARFMTEFVIQQPKLKFEQLNAEDKEKAKERFLNATRDVWEHFYYSGKWKYDGATKEYKLSDETDLDAKLSLYLLEKAGVKDILNRQALPPGEYRPGATTLDSGGILGAQLDKGTDTEPPTLRIDNHQPWRALVEGSSAKTLYRLLEAAEFPEMKDDALRALVELSVEDDNARLITSKRDFYRSHKTLRGLHRHFAGGIDALHDYVKKAWVDVGGSQEPTEGSYQRSSDWCTAYRKVLDRDFTKDEIKEYGLADQQKYRRSVIERAHSLLSQPRHVLREKGMLVNTPYGEYLVNIFGMAPYKDRFDGGHQAVAAFGFAGMVSFDERNQSFLLNTLRRDVDLSKLWKKKQGAIVRGAMVIKPANGQPLEVSLRDILSTIEAKDPPLGFIKEYEEHGLPVRLSRSKSGRRESGEQGHEDEPEEPLEKVLTGSARWRTRGVDRQVEVMGYRGLGKDGRHYVEINGTATAIPLDELEHGLVQKVAPVEFMRALTEPERAMLRKIQAALNLGMPAAERAAAAEVKKRGGTKPSGEAQAELVRRWYETKRRELYERFRLPVRKASKS